MKVAQSRLILCDPMNYTVHGILQARILECVAIPFSRGSSQPRDRTQVSSTAGGSFTSRAAREAHIYLSPPSQAPWPVRLPGCHRAPGWAPCVMQQLLTSYLFYAWQCIYVDFTFSIPPTLSFPQHVLFVDFLMMATEWLLFL